MPHPFAHFAKGWASHHKSSAVNPVCFAIRASIFGPISTLSWNAQTKSAYPVRCNVMWEEPLRTLAVHPMRNKARYTRLAFELGHLLTPKQS